jgi:hypothetical protein
MTNIRYICPDCGALLIESWVRHERFSGFFQIWLECPNKLNHGKQVVCEKCHEPTRTPTDHHRRSNTWFCETFNALHREHDAELEKVAKDVFDAVVPKE